MGKRNYVSRKISVFSGALCFLTVLGAGSLTGISTTTVTKADFRLLVNELR